MLAANRCRDRRHGQIVFARSSCIAGRFGAEVPWEARRRRVPQAAPRAFVAVRHNANRRTGWPIIRPPGYFAFTDPTPWPQQVAHIIEYPIDKIKPGLML